MELKFSVNMENLVHLELIKFSKLLVKPFMMNIKLKVNLNLKNSFSKQPLSLIMLSFQGLSDKDAEFWSNITPYFVKEKFQKIINFMIPK